jgi:spore germination protein GerM
VTKKGLIVAVSIAVFATIVALTLWLFDEPGPESEAAQVVNDQRLQVTPSPEGRESPARNEEPDVSTERRRITLYLVSQSGKTLALEDREIALADSVQEQAKQVVRELLAGSRRGLTSPLPRGVELRELFITPQGLAFVDFSQELISNHVGGTSAEELTVYSLSNTLIANFPAVKSVQFLVEGREVPTLAGHLDLTIPYGRGPRRLEQDQPSGP